MRKKLTIVTYRDATKKDFFFWPIIYGKNRVIIFAYYNRLAKVSIYGSRNPNLNPSLENMIQLIKRGAPGQIEPSNNKTVQGQSS